MSHFSEVKTNLTNRQILKKALAQLGYVIQENTNGVDVRGFMGQSLPAEFKILTKTHYDIGFVRNTAGSYDLVGDWELLPKVSGLTQSTFSAQVKKEYAKTAILELAQQKGYDVQVDTSAEDSSIEMVVTQW